MYVIRCLCPRTDIDMGCHGFSIDISAEWKEIVAASGLTQEKIDYKLKLCGNAWLDACGYGTMYDPDAEFDPLHDRSKPHGPNTRRLYDVSRGCALRVKWGEWGCEHIEVPGSATGLDIERNSFGSVFRGGVRLLPHNIDCWSQKQLLLIVFTEFAEDVVLMGSKR